MTPNLPWQHPLFKETVMITLGVLVVLAVTLFPFRNRSPFTISTWASIQSWLIGAPIIFALLGAGGSWPIAGFCFLAIIGVKEFFQMTGMYHRSSFVWLTYIAVIALSVSAYHGHNQIYNLLPMIFLAVISFVPIFQNTAKNMIQYTALSLMAFVFLGWGFLYSLWILRINEGGFLILIYIMVLSEFSDQINISVGRLWGHTKIVDKITPLRTVEGLIVATLLTILLGYGLRHLLPKTSWEYWLSVSLVASLVGGFGDLILSVIRRDIGVRDVGAFIIGRGGVLDRLDRMIFVFPVCYYLILYLQTQP